MSTPAGDGLVGNATIRIDGDTDPAMRALRQFSRDANGQLRDLRGRFASESNLITRSLTTAAGGSNRFGVSLRSLANVAGTVGGVLGRVGIGVAGLGAAAGSAAPLLAGIVTTLESIAPAGAVAVTGMLAIQQASAVVRLGMIGVGDAVTAALDPSKAAEFNQALEKLAPNARSFALAVRDLQPAFASLQQGVQNRLFQHFGDELQRLSAAVLPTVRQNLNATALTLNGMALGASVAARRLAADGTLGTAMAGATQGLQNLRRVPGQVVTALGQLAAAGAPAFDRITAGAANAATSIGQKLASAFESGALEKAVNTAIDVLKDLGTVGANIFGILGNIMAPVQQAGGGLVGVLKEITGALRDATGTQGFQQAIGALAGVMGTLARTVGPLLGQALAAIGPIFTALGPPVERLITNLGTALSPVIAALGPVLGAAAGAVGVLVDALSPLLPVIGNLIASLLPPLVPAIQAIAQAWAGAAPIVQQLGQILTAVLAPIIAQLPVIMAPLIATFTNLTRQILPVVSQLLTALAPTLASLGASFGQLLAAVAPLLAVLGQLVGQVLAALLPLLTPLIGLVAQLAAVMAGQLGSVINNIIVPALRLVTALLRGDFTGAWNALRGLFTGIGRHISTSVSNMGRVVRTILSGIVAVIRALPGRIFAALATLAGGLVRIASAAWSRFRNAVAVGVAGVIGFVRGVPGRIRGALSSLGGLLAAVGRLALSRFLGAVRSGAASAVGFVRGIPGRIRGALGGIGGLLVSAGRDLMRGMINGIKGMAGSLVSAAKGAVGGAVNAAKSALGISSPSKVFATIGKQTGQGFIKGLTGTKATIDQTADRMAASISKAFRGRTTRVDDRLVSMVQRNNTRLQRLAGQRDSIAKRIADAQKFSSDLTSKAASTGSLASVVQPDHESTSFVKKEMRQSLAQIKQFTANVQRLQKKGLGKNLLRQLLEMGPEQGAQFAASLAGADKATIKQFNSLNSQISSASNKLGRTGADLLYDSGRKASNGFLTGLKAQQKDIERLMLSIAKAMQRSIKRALGIRSPSTVFAAIGRSIGDGLVSGLSASHPKVAAAAKRIGSSAAAATGQARAARGTARATPRGGYGAAVSELQRLVDSGRWRKSGSMLFEDISFQGMSRNFRTHQMKVADGFWAAVAEIKKAVRAGKSVFEDMTFKGMSGNVSRFHDVIAQVWKGNPYGRNFGDWGNFGKYGRYGKYASGGTPRKGEVAMVGERGPELVVFGQAAKVFDAATTRAMQLGVSSMRTGGRAPATAGGDLHVHVHNAGVIGSQLELDNWLTGSLDRLARTRRLPAAVAGGR